MKKTSEDLFVQYSVSILSSIGNKIYISFLDTIEK